MNDGGGGDGATGWGGIRSVRAGNAQYGVCFGIIWPLGKAV